MGCTFPTTTVREWAQDPLANARGKEQCVSPNNEKYFYFI
jgi:hypothetical protein